MTNQYRPKKYFGQNFLADQRMQAKIIDHCNLTASDIVVEIGPGQGAISRLIAPKVKHLICIETDADLITQLKQEFKNTNTHIIHEDFLKWNFKDFRTGSNLALENNRLMSEVSPVAKVIGNIPYNISTSIIERLIEYRKVISTAYLTVQLEFGQRLASEAGSKEYGSLSCFAQYFADVKLLFKIKSACFKPAPKVDSCFMRIDFTRPALYHPNNEHLLFQIIRTAFNQRRKNILNALSPLVDKQKLTEVLQTLKISTNTRPEELNLNNFVAISNMLVLN